MRNFYWASLLLLPLPVFSQTQPEKGYFVGLEVGHSGAYRSDFGWAGQGFAPIITAGKLLKPGLTLQLGLSASQSRFEHRERWVIRANYPQPFPINVYSQTRQRTLLLPILLRIDLGKPAQRRLQLQAIAGATVMAYMHYDKQTQADSTNAVFFTNTNRSTSFDLGLTGGGGLLYKASPHMDLTATALLNLPLRPLAYIIYGSAGVTSTVSIGTRYYLKARP
ncbi:hypothetical protein J0X19_22500 [Hymenobacter sp. BT186]|uniref:Outer membrane protein beta-barrel domain-containing protein n=1 Tax=Hymenobacter telluris TaxID=2816474 RepID=A0A939EZJ6_9BACT|nr:hypothetical protein [Hymenobacter telluris]MBO0360749.1 hypothetical protein [Hymenobacter telluris]MBW3376777.1 hypothetical protein [Hymenobacter norwichensis]